MEAEAPDGSILRGLRAWDLFTVVSGCMAEFVVTTEEASRS